MNSLLPIGGLSIPPVQIGGVAPAIPPKPDHFIGRAREVDQAIAALTAGQHVCVMGPGGIGKTGLTKVVANHPSIASAFPKRFFVRLESTQVGNDIVQKLAEAMGLQPGPSALEAVLSELDQIASLIVLDNAEMPWEHDPRGTEAFLADCGARARVLLSIRGGQTPQGLEWNALKLGPLALEDATTLFLSLANGISSGDSLLPKLMQVTDRIPLVVRLLAAQASGAQDLRDLWTRFEREQASLLHRNNIASREDNFTVSVMLSVNSRRMVPEAKRLLGVLGLLPGGLARSVAAEVLSGGADAVGRQTLIQLGLAFEEMDRLRLLVPVREVVVTQVQPEAADRTRLDAWALTLALEGEKAGTVEGSKIIARLGAEFDNLFALLSRLVEERDSKQAAKAIIALAEYQRFSGLGTDDLLKRAAGMLQDPRDRSLLAQVTAGLGNIAVMRSDFEGAWARFEEALPLYRDVGDTLGEANCIFSLGEIALRTSDFEGARARFEGALPLYQKISNWYVLGFICLRLSEIAINNAEEQKYRAAAQNSWSKIKEYGQDLIDKYFTN